MKNVRNVGFDFGGYDVGASLCAPLVHRHRKIARFFCNDVQKRFKMHENSHRHRKTRLFFCDDGSRMSATQMSVPTDGLSPRSRAVLFGPPSCVFSLPAFILSLPVFRHPGLVLDGRIRFHPVRGVLLHRGLCVLL